MENKQITSLMEALFQELCDKYCKFPEQYAEGDEDRLYDEHCNDCPMMRW